MTAMRMRARKIIYIGVLFFMAPSVYAVPVLQIDGSGQLIGATGVNVNGVMYDVTIGDQGGTCAAAHGGACATSNFEFTTLSDANAASQALLDQVLINTFDNDPSLTSGVTDMLLGVLVTAYGVDPAGILVSFARNEAGQSTDTINNSLVIPGVDLLGSPAGTWATWRKTIQSNQVPEPNPLLLLGIGLAALQVVRRKGIAAQV